MTYLWIFGGVIVFLLALIGLRLDRITEVLANDEHNNNTDTKEILEALERMQWTLEAISNKSTDIHVPDIPDNSSILNDIESELSDIEREMRSIRVHLNAKKRLKTNLNFLAWAAEKEKITSKLSKKDADILINAVEDGIVKYEFDGEESSLLFGASYSF